MSGRGHTFMRKHNLLASCLSAVLIICMNATLVAGEQERYDLALVAKELDTLVQQIGNIKTNANEQQDSQIKFQFDDLIRDLNKVKDGISDYVSAELRHGNNIAPLDGRYR
jgi:RAQPRD family integrative conjugative element protein